MRIIFLLLFISTTAFSQNQKPAPTRVPRPKLVVGLVVDQMRWDYLYRYYDRYAADGGFKRLLNKGFRCENTFINYIPSYTACGHATIYTGSIPAIHGITGNEWWQVLEKKEMYCVQDDAVRGVGTNSAAGQMSPRNMMVTSICDELKLATNFRSKVVGVAFKDRGGILPAGHAADAAYWYEAATGKFITSTYYMQQLPGWVNEFNNKKLPDTYLKQGWNTLYPPNTYVQSTSDEQPFEGKPFGPEQKGFPYKLEQFVGNNYGALTNTPYGNTLTKDMAMAAVNGEELGKDSITDFLAISFSTPDYIGHSFGPNSIEAEDNFLRLDKDLGQLFQFLDKKVGAGQYLVFISADHAVAHVPAYMAEKKLPGASVNSTKFDQSIDSILKKKYGNHKLIATQQNAQLFFNHDLIDSLKLNKKEISTDIINYLSKQPDIERVFELQNVINEPLVHKLKTSVVNGYYPKRSGDIQFIMKPGYFFGGTMGTTHGSPYPYDTHIPLVWYGWKVKPGMSSREMYMTDIAPTIATMLSIQMPNGSVGTAISEVIGN